MKYRLVVTSLAQQEIADALNYYSKINISVATRFLEVLEVAYNKLEETPQHCSYFGDSEKIRTLSFKHFPYCLIFSINERTVVVVGLYNTFQNPDSFLNRTT